MKFISVKAFFLVALALSCYSCMQPQGAKQQREDEVLAVIPKPQIMKALPEAFSITDKTTIHVPGSDRELERLATFLATAIKDRSGHVLSIVTQSGDTPENAIVLTIADAPDTLGNEGYWLRVEQQGIVLKAPAAAGVFYGIQTLSQLLPTGAAKAPASVRLPAVEVIDKPRHVWRGAMLDVGRYFYPVEDVKKVIDYMAMYKMNTFQWHLTEDQGWRIEIKKYPALTTTSAWRDATIVGHLNDQPRQYDGQKHGGYYTQDQVREIIAYAAERYITVIPEIEMPGHSVAALAAYPELSCTGGPFKVSQTWGVHEDVYCAGNEQTFAFLEDVLTEVADLFPSPVIHIGGDECPKTRWKACGKCQARIKREHLKDEHELQSYFIKRMERFLQTRNKRIIGWDEILEGGLAPNAMVMSWRGTAGGITAAKQRHGVVMTPRNPAYMDYYQGDPALEPLTIGGKNVLRDVYAYDPVPAELTKEEAQYILGSQANIWTEYMPDLERVEYMIMPRMAALAEVVWTLPAQKNWDDFARRMQVEYARYAAAGINYSTSAYHVQYTLTVTPGPSATLALHNDVPDAAILYTTDGTAPDLNAKPYTSAITVDGPLTINAASFINGEQHGKTTTRYVVLNPAFNRDIRFVTNPDRRAVAGNKSLLNNLKGSADFRDGEWTGYYGKEMTVILDLDTLVEVSGIRASFLSNPKSNAFLPATITYAVSADGESYTPLNTAVTPSPATDKDGSTELTGTFPSTRARYIKVTATPRLNGGEKTWMYADEIIIDPGAE